MKYLSFYKSAWTVRVEKTTRKYIFKYFIYFCKSNDPTKKRPIKVVFNTEAEKNKIMENLKELKGQEKFRGMSITDDYTLAERQIIKEYSDKAKDYNNKEPQDSDYVWRVRGSPKNGLRLKKFQKQGGGGGGGGG